MIVRKETYYIKKINIIDRRKCFDTQARRRVSYLIFGLIPIFISDGYVEGALKK